jgi:hypothetical protein
MGLKDGGSWKLDRTPGVKSGAAGVWALKPFEKRCLKSGKTSLEGEKPPTGAASSSMKLNINGRKDSISGAFGTSSKLAMSLEQKRSSVEGGTGERLGWPGGSIHKAG